MQRRPDRGKLAREPSPRKKKRKTFFQCPHCTYNTDRKFDFDAHARIHSNEKPFPCPHCDYRGRIKIQVRYHIRKQHQNLTNKTIPTAKALQCKLCSHSTFDSKLFRFHFFTHTRENPFGCNVCDFVCAKGEILREHFETKHLRCEIKQKKAKNANFAMRKIDGIIYCDLCNYSSTNKYLFQSHLLVHAKKRFKCLFCEYRCRHKHGLRTHWRRAHDKVMTDEDAKKCLLDKKK